MLSALERTRSLLHDTAQRWSAHVACPIASTSRPLFAESLPLPSTESLLPSLLAVGIEETSAGHIDNAFSQAVAKLETLCCDDYKRRCSSFATHFQDARAASLVYRTYTTVFTKTSHQWRAYIMNDFIPRYIAARGSHVRTRSPSLKKPFNQSAIPILERFFDENAFPSRLEKYELASKCEMDFRQIHVWFQNRRSRFRKEGRELKKCSSSTPLSDALENSETLLPGETDDGTDTTDDALFPLPATVCNNGPVAGSFNLKAPAHAFPSPFPPCCPYEPFPQPPNRPAFSLPWPYTSRTERPLRDATDISDLTSLFTKLAITEQGTNVEYAPTRRQSSTVEESPCLGFVTLCSQAPHPAFIRRPERACRSVTRTTSRRSPRQGRPSSFASPSSSTPTMGRTKHSLPRRVPKYPMRCLSARPSPTPSRRSSFDSVSSRSSMSISSSSDSDDPATPPLLPTSTLFTSTDPFALYGPFAQKSHSPDLFDENFVSPVFSETSLRDVVKVLSKASMSRAVETVL